MVVGFCWVCWNVHRASAPSHTAILEHRLWSLSNAHTHLAHLVLSCVDDSCRSFGVNFVVATFVVDTEILHHNGERAHTEIPIRDGNAETLDKCRQDVELLLLGTRMEHRALLGPRLVAALPAKPAQRRLAMRPNRDTDESDCRRCQVVGVCGGVGGGAVRYKGAAMNRNRNRERKQTRPAQSSTHNRP